MVKTFLDNLNYYDFMLKPGLQWLGWRSYTAVARCNSVSIKMDLFFGGMEVRNNIVDPGRNNCKYGHAKNYFYIITPWSACRKTLEEKSTDKRQTVLKLIYEFKVSRGSFVITRYLTFNNFSWSTCDRLSQILFR